MAFASCSALTDITLPDGVTSIGGQAFLWCSSLTNFALPKSLTTLYSEAFHGCSGLTNVVIPNGVTVIPTFAFADCTGLKTVTIGRGVTNIAGNAFTDCRGLTSITIPSNVRAIDSYAFSSCPNLAAIYFQGDAPVAGSYVFQNDSVTVYRLPNTGGWEGFTQGTPVLWDPHASGLEMRANQFGFTVGIPSGATVVVEACTNLSNPVWCPVGTNTAGANYFTDPQSGSNPKRFYRLRNP
jgi:hypothetical protein